jgi:hypothetical protein
MTLIGVLDERTDEPKVGAPHEGRRPDGWYNLGKVKVRGRRPGTFFFYEGFRWFIDSMFP